MSAHRHVRFASQGFTLIELLVVISIIALLIGILLPALGAARSVAKDMQCLSNTRQVSIASLAYAVDNKDYAVLASSNGKFNGDDNTPGTSALETKYWTATLVIGGYGATNEMFFCPSFDNQYTNRTDSKQFLQTMLANPADARWRHSDYGTNWYTVTGRRAYKRSTESFDQSCQRSVSTGAIKSPGETVFVADSWYEQFDGNVASQRGIYVIGGIATSGGGVHARHKGTAINIGWMDGHSSAFGVGSPKAFEDMSTTRRADGPWGDKNLGTLGLFGSSSALNRWDDQ